MEQRRTEHATFGRRLFVGGSASLAAAATVGANAGVAHAASTTAAATQASGTDLGVPIRAVNVRAGASGTLRGRSVLYVFSNGSPGVFNVLDAETGERITAHELTGYESSHGFALSPDGTVYIEGRPGGRLFRYFPEDDRLVDLGKVAPHAFSIPDIAIDNDGVVYGGTSREGHLFTYDPDADEFTDHGVVAEGETYAHVGAVHNGVAYVGTRQNARFFEIDVPRGEKREIDLPPPYDSSEVRALPQGYRQGLVFLHVSTSHAMLVYDTQSGEWIDELPGHASGGPTNPVGKTVYAEHRETGQLWSYDLAQQHVDTIDFDTTPLGTITRVMGLANFGGDEFPAATVAGMGTTARMWHWNPSTGSSRWLDGDVQGGPVRIRAIGAAPDGNIYVGPYYTSGAMGRYIVAEDRIEHLEGPNQVEGFGAFDGKLYMGTYTGAGIMEFDPQQEWEFGTNPRTLFDLRDQGQDRPWALLGVGDRLAIGTIAAAGSLDGALTFDDNGRLWGLTNNARVFEFDMDSREVVRSVFVKDDSDANTGMPRLFIGPDGAFYGTLGNNHLDLFRVDPSTLDAQILDTESAFACLGPDGAIYYAKNDSSLYRWTLDG